MWIGKIYVPPAHRSSTLTVGSPWDTVLGICGVACFVVALFFLFKCCDEN